MSLIKNYYEEMPKKYKAKQRTYKNFDKIHISIPNRIAVIGSSGSGKSNILLNLIIGMNCFSKIYMFIKCPEEPLYKFIIEELRLVEKKLKTEILFVSTDMDELPSVDDFDPDQNNLCIFDDVISESISKLKNVSDLWIRGRKQNITTIFLSQSYTAIPKLIRKNTDVIIFKKIGTKRDLSLILSEYSLDLPLDELKRMYKSCHTSSITNFFMINQSARDPKYMYCHNFDAIPRIKENEE